VPDSFITTISLARLHEELGRGAYVCFACRAFDPPKDRSISEEASNSVERSCRWCGKPSAVTLERALDEKWLVVEAQS
jgi:predicted RNA-binding protein YlxR (DUF448 family)